MAVCKEKNRDEKKPVNESRAFSYLMNGKSLFLLSQGFQNFAQQGVKLFHCGDAYPLIR